MNLSRNNGREQLDTHSKALRINIDGKRYGTFAEIGAGQEVVRWFFRVGGAAGTIAKSMSAYDMTVSDAIYGKCGRYVSRERLESMLSHEHSLNIERLKDSRGDMTSFFVFADTVSARNYLGTNDCHGWMGVRFQSHPRDDDSQIILHVRMLDNEAALQQEAIGIVGVNLLYGAFYYSNEPDLLVESLLDNLTTQRIEIDMIELSGIEFRHVDNRLMSLKLVQQGLSNAAMFGPDGKVLQPSEVLYKKNILVERGSFRPVCHVHLDMLHAAEAKFAALPDTKEEEIIVLMELTMKNLMEGKNEIDHRDFLARADMLAACGKTVLISNYFEYYRLAAYLARYTKKRLAIVMGAVSLKELFDEKYYAALDGGILESFGRLFKNDMRLFIYPYREAGSDEMQTVENLEIPSELRKLYEYLVERGGVLQLDNYREENMSMFSRVALEKIRTGDATWETMVPPEVANVIKSRKMLGYRPKSC